MTSVEWRSAEGIRFAQRELPDGRVATASPLFGGRGRLKVGPDETYVTDNW